MNIGYEWTIIEARWRLSKEGVGRQVEGVVRTGQGMFFLLKYILIKL